MIFIIRMFLMLWVVIGFGVFGLIYCIFRPTSPSNTLAVARFFSIGLEICNIDFKCINKDKLNIEGTGVFISNHQSNWDTLPMGRIVPYRCVSIGKKEIVWFPFFGLVYWLSGNILLNRGNKRSAWSTMDKIITALTQNNTSVWIMPEGTRSKGNGVGNFKKGAFYVAVKAQRPIIPVAVSSFHKFVDLKKWNSGPLRVKVLDPIETKGLTEQDIPELLKRAQEMISFEVDKLDEQLARSSQKFH